ncbi:bifunctional diguanylate cyclase/phosphodiesterase [Plastoroseomonas arctica]|uniref:EAL domain-containing protein n=1 Tax=Plastoroseomonas arctica TaxID=1509237 RepID=A0AAF1JWL2_9PROT|nr:EAL domain-containing protein [Plastoroseomonas arctica]MBR0655327.1 EAL domain-containing protein [Plastoroseomonas arctica]
MRTLYLCVTERHNLPLVAVAAILCAVGIWTSFALGHEAVRAQTARARRAWGLAAVLAASSAVWATHFIAMIAYEPGLPYRFDTATSVWSFVIALALFGAASAVILTMPSLAGRLIGGGIGGLAISAMHYTGMNAFRTQGALVWDMPVIGVSVAFGIAFAVAAALMPASRSRGVRHLAPVALILAVCLDHFIGMSAVTIAFDPTIPEPSEGINLTLLAAMVANLAFGIVALSIAAVWLQMRDLADISIEGLLICEDNRVVGMNRSLEMILGTDRNQVIGREIATLLPQLPGGVAPGAAETDTTLQVEGADPVPVKVIAKFIHIAGKTRIVVAVRDQRERISTEASIRRLAHEDTLTGLANRFSFNTNLSTRFASRREGGRSFALFMLDLDRFKIVNDTLGHGVGDEVLKRVAQRLAKAIRTADLLARLGGDEFAIVLDNARQPADVSSAAERIIEVLARPFIIKGQVIEIGVSVGIAFAPTDGTSTEALSRSADLALYRAKEEGRGAYRFYEQEMNARMQARRTFEHDLRRAIARQELFVVYQPQVDSTTGRFDGAEALVRWNHPDQGIVSPAAFIPLAEDLGLIGAVGEFVLRKACTDAMTWPSHMTVSVNLSPMQLRDQRLAARVACILAETGLSGARLELELTENALLQDDGRTIAMLHALRALGIRISMDDFGTGYSSISYLRRFPFDKIKIDQSFVRQLPEDGESTAIVRAIATLGQQLGMTVTAEGVETDAQRRFVSASGCGQLQGFLFSKPVTASDVRAMFDADALPTSAVA